MTILGSNGNIGIGMNAPTAMLHVTGTSILGGASTHGSTLNVVGAVSMSSTLNVSGTTSIMGNIGIGTTAPTHSLHIAKGNDSIRLGATNFLGTAADITTYGLERSRNQIIFSTYRDVMADKIGAKIVGINKQTYLDVPSNRVAIQSTDIAFFTVPPNAQNYDDTVERFRIMDSGNVGIGMSSPSALLHVNGTTIIGGAMTANSTLNVSGTSIFNGNVGIGTNTPSYKLHVANAGDSVIMSECTNSTSYGYMVLKANGTTTSFVQRNTGNFNITNGGNSIMEIANSTGNVGFGTTTPSASFHIAGTSILSGASTHGSTLNIVGGVSMASTLNISGTTSIMGTMGIGTVAPTST
jgi:hypothetical protein